MNRSIAASSRSCTAISRRVLALDQPLLGVEQALQVGVALQILEAGEPGRLAGLGDDLGRCISARSPERLTAEMAFSDVREAVEQGLAVERDAFRLLPGREFEIAAQPAAVEDRREQAGAGGEESC